MTGILAALLPAHDDLTGEALDAVVAQTVGAAMRFAGIIHVEDPADLTDEDHGTEALLGSLTSDQRWALPYLLAAMVDVEKTAAETLAWAGFQPPQRLRNATSVAPASVLLDRKRTRARYSECGTAKGWAAHVTKNDDPCDECNIAQLAEDRAQLRAELTKHCGTNKGWNVHKWRGQKPCRPCADAHNATDTARKTAGRYRQMQLTDGREEATNAA